MIAKAVKNIFNEIGIRLPASDIMPNENAISVAMGMAKPCCVGVPWLK